MTNDEIRMTKPKRRWLAIVEGVMFFWFLMIGYLGVSKLGQILICMQSHGPLKAATMPGFTSMVSYLLPESAFGLLIGIICPSIGFAFVSSVSNEGLTSRWFRWAFVLVFTAFFGMAVPIIESRTCLCGGLDTTWFDEVLVATLGFAAMLIGIRHAKRHP